MLISFPAEIFFFVTKTGGDDCTPRHFHICAYWARAIFETPIFNPKFPLQSISFSQITEKSAPEHHHFRVLGEFFPAPETIIFNNVTDPRPVFCGQPEREAFRQRFGAPTAKNQTTKSRDSPSQGLTFSR